MRIRSTNQLNMVGTCLTVANSDDYKSVWSGKEPADFGPDLNKLSLGYEAASSKAALAESAIGGAADAKAAAESALEEAAHLLARALANHYKKTGNLVALAKVDLSRSDIVKLRGQELVTRATEIRDLGDDAQSETAAAARGVTAARVTALSTAIAAFAAAINQPRGQIVNRGTLLKELETDVAGLIAQVHDLDDLVMQFDGTEAGRRFIEAWRRARIIVDAGGGRGDDAAKSTASAATTTAISAATTATSTAATT